MYDSRKKRSNYSSLSVEPSRRSKNPLDINDIEGARPQPISFIRKKQQLLNDMKTNSHTLANSGRITPLRIDRSYDSRRYMRVEDIDPRLKPGKIVVNIQPPSGL